MRTRLDTGSSFFLARLGALLSCSAQVSVRDAPD